MGAICIGREDIVNSYKIYVGKLQGNRSLEIPRYGWDNNITGSSGKNKSLTFLDITRATFKTTCPTILLLLRL
jgi:hypothetical protein